MRKKDRYFWPLLALILILPFFWGMQEANPKAVANDLTFGDFVDQELIVSGLERTKNFAQTLSWWSGSWVAGEKCKFYRPLTSLIWWSLFQASGASRYSQGAMVSFMAVQWLSHFAVCLVLGGFLRRLVGARTAMLAVTVWTVYLVDLVKLPIPLWALQYWKDSPDIWVSGAIILSLWSLLSLLRTGEKRFVYWTFAAQILAIGFKEMAYVVPFMAAVLVWFERDQGRLVINQRRSWQIVAGLFAIVVVAYVFRFWALDGPGFRFGTNGSWLGRFMLYVAGGKAVNLASQGDLIPLCTAFLLVGIVYGFRGERRKAYPFGITGVIGIAAGGREAMFRILQPLFATQWYASLELHQTSFVTALLMLTMLWAWKRRDKRMLFASGWIVTAYLPLLSAPITSHALYLCSIGWALWWSIALCDLAQSSMRFYSMRKPRENSSVVSAPI